MVNTEHEPSLRESACELTWKKYFNTKIPKIVKYLSDYDSFRHVSYNKEDYQKVMNFQYGARTLISNINEAFVYLIENIKTDDIIDKILSIGENVYKYLKKEAEYIYSKSFEVDIYDRHYDEQYKFLCVNNDRFNPINFGIDYTKDGYDGFLSFTLNKDMYYYFSIYSDKDNVDCSNIARHFNGGGHKGASGFRVKSLDDVFNMSKNEFFSYNDNKRN
jgi:hypothetical protein